MKRHWICSLQSSDYSQLSDFSARANGPSVTNTLLSPPHCDLWTGSTLRDKYGPEERTPPEALKHTSVFIQALCVGLLAFQVPFARVYRICLYKCREHSDLWQKRDIWGLLIKAENISLSIMRTVRCNVASFKAHVFCCYSGTVKSDKTKLVQENSYCNSGDFTQIQIITFNMTSVSTFYFGISIFIPAAQRIAKPAGTFLVPRIQLLLRSPGQAPSFPNTTSSRLGP